MKIFFQYLKFITSAFLVIFILGSKPAKVKGQESEKKEKQTCTIKVVKDKEGKKVVLDTTFTWVDDKGLEHTLLDLDLDDCEDNAIIMKVKETDDGLAYVYCFSENDGKGIANTKALAKITCTDKDRVWTITYDEDGDMKLVVKKKKDGKSEDDIYLIESGSRTGDK